MDVVIIGNIFAVMFELISNLNLSHWQWILFIICGILTGMSKSGLSGAGLIIVPVMASIFGGKHSVGIVLPMLIMADLFAVKYYHRHANWKSILTLLPWAIVGIVLGSMMGNMLNDVQFKQLLAVIIIIGIVLMLWNDWRKKSTVAVPNKWWFAAILGLAGGFTTMVGNAAGPIMAIYLLSMRLPKNSYIGTGAWFFLMVNVIKIPFHVFWWKTITLETLSTDLLVLPGIIIGILIGIKAVKLMPEKVYRIFIIVSTVVSALFLF